MSYKIKVIQCKNRQENAQKFLEFVNDYNLTPKVFARRETIHTLGSVVTDSMTFNFLDESLMKNSEPYLILDGVQYYCRDKLCLEDGDIEIDDGILIVFGER